MSETPPGTELEDIEKMPAILRGTLERFDQEGVLEPGETVVDRELAGMKRTPGVLFLTDRRVLFFHASPVSDRTSLVSMPLDGIASVEASERRSPLRKRGVVRLGAAGEADDTVVEHIPGGHSRAEQIAGTIVRLRDAARGGSVSEIG